MSHPAWLSSVFSAVTTDFITPLPARYKEMLTIRLRVAQGSPVKAVYVRCAPEGSGRFWQMTRVESKQGFDIYSLQFQLNWKIFNYQFFLLTQQDETYWFNSMGIDTCHPVNHHDFRLNADPQLPDWVTDTVFYQIFPDRFYNGNAARNYQPGEKTISGESVTVKNWGELPEGNFDFFNGDLEGVQQKLDHLQRLGVNGLYLNPILLAPSNHHYDFLDYFEIDPHLGDLEVFGQLVDDVHQRGMTMMLDGVFNHTGASHRWFNKAGYFESIGAYDAEASPYDDFYIFNQHPDDYVGWWGFDSLPKLNYQSQKLRDAIYRDDDSVIKTWLKPPYNIDAWRFDVANMQARYEGYQAGYEVWKETRQAVKADFPNAYLMGEHFYDGSELCQGDALDAQMNYMGFYYPIFNWLTGIFDFNADGQYTRVPYQNCSGITFQQQLQQFLAQVPYQNALQMYNLLNSHDRPRLISVLQGDRQKLTTALIFLFSYVGVPSVYYGDEVGLEGEGDPDCRRCMPWDESQWDMTLFSQYQQLIALRKASAALKTGALQWLHVSDDAVVYCRFLGAQRFVIVLHNPRHHASAESILIDATVLGQMTDVTTVFGSAQANVVEQQLRLPAASAIYQLD